MQFPLCNREPHSQKLFVAYVIQTSVLGLHAALFLIIGSPFVQTDIIIACFGYSLVGIFPNCRWSVMMLVLGVFLGVFIPIVVAGGADHVRIWGVINGLTFGGAIGLAAGVAVDYFNASARIAKSSVCDYEAGQTQPPFSGDSP